MPEYHKPKPLATLTIQKMRTQQRAAIAKWLRAQADFIEATPVTELADTFRARYIPVSKRKAP